MSKLKSNVVEETPVSESEIEVKSTKQLSKELLRKFIDEETKTVKGKFRNIETPGGSTKIFVRKYPGIEPFEKVMEDGLVYEVPLYVARHLNGTDVTATHAGKKINTCAYPTHGFKARDNGELTRSGDDAGIPVPIIGPVKWNRRYAFESLEFDVG